MKLILRFMVLCLSYALLFSCAPSAYITDPESVKQQKEMHKYRTGINFADAGLLVAGGVSQIFTGVNFYSEPRQQSFRKLVLVNQSSDTLFINMVTDKLWKDSTYCDIRDIVMPPHQSAQILVPMGATYNVFFRNDFDAPDDEKIEINTSNTGKVKLNPAKAITETPNI